MIELVPFEPPRVDPILVLRLQKYAGPEAAPPVVRESAEQMAALARTLVRPRGWVWRGTVRHTDAVGTVTLDDGLIFESHTLARRLQDASSAVIFLLTIGEALETRVHYLAVRGRRVEGFLLDVAGTAAIHEMVATLRARLGAAAQGLGLRLTPRMAPGFGDWPLEQQQILFSAFGAATPDVRLTDASVMLPGKSVSGLYGLVPARAR